MARQRRQRRGRTLVLYVLALLREFRWTLAVLGVALVVGTALYLGTPDEFAPPSRPSVLNAVYASWMAMFAQPVNALPSTWYLTVLCGLYPVLGFIVVGEGVVRLALLMFSRRHGRKEWMRVMASTYRDHVVLCGIGHLGIRVLEQLVAAGVEVVAVERDENGAFVAAAKRLGAPVILGDMKDDKTLVEAGVPAAAVVVIATNDDMANLEVALDSRRLNPRIRVVMRLFEQSIAQKIAGAFLVDVAFSASTLAAPMVVAMSLGARVVQTAVIAGIAHVTAEVTVAPGSDLAGKRVDEAERGWCCKVLARQGGGEPAQLPPEGGVMLRAGDVLTVHTPSAQLATVASAAGQGSVAGA